MLTRKSKRAIIVFYVIAIALLVIVVAFRDELRWTGLIRLLMISITTTFLGFILLRRRNPEVINARMESHKGTEKWDKIWVVLYSLMLPLMLSLSFVDSFWLRWSNMSSAVVGLGAALWLAGYAIFYWAMSVNPFFEKTVRIQTDRGQRVVDVGPYRIIRHPGYFAGILIALSMPMILGSWLASVASVLMIGLFIIRTYLEDLTLMHKLNGYIEYAVCTRFRLIPGIW